MADHTDGQVCLLIDFENLARGLADLVGDEGLADTLDAQLLFSLAEEYGRVVVARAYADWRMKVVNQFQFDLYNLGVDLVHVLAKHQKNAVDVKLAVDAIELLWELPLVSAYVLVSGDRDFIHVLKALRRHGKTVVGVAPDNAVSDDFAALCDRFVAYTALRRAYAATDVEAQPGTEKPQMAVVRDALSRLLVKHPEGIKGSQVIPALRREISPTFDVSAYGYVKLSQLLRALPEVVRLEGGEGGDILVKPADSGSPAAAAPIDEVANLIVASGLKDYRYEPNAEQRRRLLRIIYRVMTQQGTFTWNEVAEQVAEETHDIKLSVSLLAKYQAILWQSRAFVVLPDQAERPLREREMQLVDGLDTLERFVTRFEYGVVYKARQAKAAIDAPLAARLLGLDFQAPQVNAYCRQLLTYDGKSNHGEVPVPGVRGELDPVFTKKLLALFPSSEEKLSRGRLLSGVIQQYAEAGRELSRTEAEALFQVCLDRGVLLQTRDGVTKAYQLAAAPGATR